MGEAGGSCGWVLGVAQVQLVWGWRPQQAHLPGACEMQMMRTIGPCPQAICGRTWTPRRRHRSLTLAMVRLGSRAAPGAHTGPPLGAWDSGQGGSFPLH